LGQRLLVVGASSGVGAATAIAAAGGGASVILAARRVGRLEAVAAQCDSRAVAVECDVRQPEDCKTVVDKAVATLGGLDAVVYSAGVSDLAAVVDTPAEEWYRILETNVVGAALVFAAASGHLQQSRGSMIVISSISVLRPKPGLVPYAASKAALQKLIEGLRSEHPDISFTVVTIGPTAGGEFGRGFDPTLAAALTEQWKQQGYLAPGQMPAHEVARRILDCVTASSRTEELVLLPRP
jgi:NAD(P)-dependent dehydrogenase (short-subunit alcohol dehydrogenase family)